MLNVKRALTDCSFSVNLDGLAWLESWLGCWPDNDVIKYPLFSTQPSVLNINKVNKMNITH